MGASMRGGADGRFRRCTPGGGPASRLRAGASRRVPRPASSSPTRKPTLFCDAAPECAAARRRHRQRGRQRVLLAGAGFRVAVRVRRAPDRLHRRDGLLAERRRRDRGSPARYCRRSGEREASARFYIVGMNPDAAVRALASDPARRRDGHGSTTFARICSMRAVVVAPLRVARGIQNKVLEAMAMAKPVVVTPPMAAGMSARRGVELEVASEAAEFAEKVVALMDPERARRMGTDAACAGPPRLRVAGELCAARRTARARRRGCRATAARVFGERRAIARWRRVERSDEDSRPCRCRVPNESPASSGDRMAIGVARRRSRWSSLRSWRFSPSIGRPPNRSSRSGRARRHSRTAI